MVLEIIVSEENRDEEFNEDPDDEEEDEAEDDNEATTSAETKDVSTDSTPSKINKQSSTDNEQMSGACKLFCKACRVMSKLYNHISESHYRKRVVLGVVIFILALKLADECYGLVLPVRDYVPFEDYN